MIIQRVKVKGDLVKWASEDGHIYRFKRKLKDPQSRKVFLVCNSRDCRGSGHGLFAINFEDKPEVGEFQLKSNHTPGAKCKDLNFLNVNVVRNKILQRAAQENTPNSIIFQEEMESALPEVRAALSFKQMERAMQRARQKVHPGTPHSLSELAQSISDWNDRYGKLNGKPFFLGKFGTENEECLVAVVSDIVDNQFNLNSDWHLDGTFKCRPKDPKFCQLYVIMASAYGRSFPIVWALMKTRTVAAYNVLFSAVKTHIPGVMPTHIMSDYEKALWTAVKQNFPEATHLGCWFYFAQAIERNAKKVGITCRGDGWIVAKRLMATALLPYHRIEEAVNLIEGFAHSCNEPAPAMRLLQYFQREWMGKVTPKSFSVFEQKNRTNNAQEALNRCINRTIRPQGNTWEFWNGLMQISSKEAHSFSLLREGKECARKKKLKWILQDSNLKFLDEKLRRGDITLAEFISAASYRVASDIVDVDEDEDMEDDQELISLNEPEEEGTNE